VPQTPKQLLRIFTNYGQMHSLLTYMTEEDIKQEIDTAADDDWVHIKAIRQIDDASVSCRHLKSTIVAFYVEPWSAALLQQQQQPQNSPRIVQ
jgi:hypothetical protein